MISFLEEHIAKHNIKAFLFDLNGTMVNDMPYHIKAWHQIINSLGRYISLEDMKKECYGKNEEVIERVIPQKYTLEEKTNIGLKKEEQYRKEFLPDLKLLPGLQKLLQHFSDKNIKMAIGSAAIRPNIDFVLNGCDIGHFFQTIVSADDVTLSKPHPETFLKCAKQLCVNYNECIVFEDSIKGIECAVNAGMKSVAITTMHIKEEFYNLDDDIIRYAKDYTA
jgi:beta-phosphoglucomutase family hydrolase